jgi:hypothetical protein
MGKMTHNKKLRQLFLWLAIVSVLLPSLVPSVSRILSGQSLSALEWVEACTPEGLKRLPVSLFENGQGSQSRNPENPDPQSGGHFVHCPFCLTNACSFGLVPGDAWLPLMAASSDSLPPHALSALHGRSVRQPHQARAPPVFL